MFISEEIEVWFREEPALKKKTGVPAGFVWSGERFEVSQLLAEWHDFGKAREAGDTRRTEVQLVRTRGSWGLGRDYYRVRTVSGREFDIYYDRRPKSREIIGVWVLWRELVDANGATPIGADG